MVENARRRKVIISRMRDQNFQSKLQKKISFLGRISGVNFLEEAKRHTEAKTGLKVGEDLKIVTLDGPRSFQKKTTNKEASFFIAEQLKVNGKYRECTRSHEWVTVERAKELFQRNYVGFEVFDFMLDEIKQHVDDVQTVVNRVENVGRKLF